MTYPVLFSEFSLIHFIDNENRIKLKLKRFQPKNKTMPAPNKILVHEKETSINNTQN